MGNFTGHKISLTYDKVVQVPDQATGILQDGLGVQVYTNSDSIGTIKMFYPMSGVLADYFDIGTGLAVPGTQWENWAICDGQNSTPNLRGKFVVGQNPGILPFSNIGDNGGSSTITALNLPPHRHKYYDAFMNAIDGGDVFSSEVDAHAASEGTLQGPIYTSSLTHIQEGGGSSRDAVWYDRNTSDGTDNISFVGIVGNTDYHQPFYTLLYVIKIS